GNDHETPTDCSILGFLGFHGAPEPPSLGNLAGAVGEAAPNCLAHLLCVRYRASAKGRSEIPAIGSGLILCFAFYGLPGLWPFLTTNCQEPHRRWRVKRIRSQYS